MKKFSLLVMLAIMFTSCGDDRPQANNEQQGVGKYKKPNMYEEKAPQESAYWVEARSQRDYCDTLEEDLDTVRAEVPGIITNADYKAIKRSVDQAQNLFLHSLNSSNKEATDEALQIVASIAPKALERFYAQHGTTIRKARKSSKSSDSGRPKYW